jgi:(S)-2-hydroxyglutarate dehydrogenase
MKISIIGGGIVGLAVARELHRSHPGSEVTLFEKEEKFGSHQSSHNSGVLHAGLYYKPGSLKARLAVRGIRKMVAFCKEHSVDHEICGKLVVATNEEEINRLRELHQRGTENGLVGLKWLNRDEMLEIEPWVGGVFGLKVPEEGIVDYAGVCDALVTENRKLGAHLFNNVGVAGLHRNGKGWVVATPVSEQEADYIINCAGLQCDRVAEKAGEPRVNRIIPFRGEYYSLKPTSQHLVRNLIYPVPDPKFPFLGVHFTRLIHGGIEAGPNAVLALAREGYRKWDINPRDMFDALTSNGLWKFVYKHREIVWEEITRSFSKRLFCKSLQRLVPSIQENDLGIGGAGVRAQAMEPSGTLLQDFAFIEQSNALHLINAPSPAATAALAIAEEIVKKIPQSK